jgi:hypothetical protein
VAEFVYHQLACYQHLHPGGFDVVDMHKNIGPAIIRQDEAKPAICVEELHPASWHAPINPIVSAPANVGRDGPELVTKRHDKDGLLGWRRRQKIA